jgi:NADP-dependent 3-hydroxy acid dehydrogenase YdfG
MSLKDTLQGKVVVITGASSGIGEAAATALAEAGAKLVLAARRGDRLQKLKDKLPGETLVVTADVTKREDVERVAKEAMEAFGRVDILVNNAGIMLPSRLDEVKVDEWERMIDVNLKGVLYGVAAFLPIMKQQKSGHILNISSNAAHRVKQGAAIYSATKFAVRALTEGLRLELAPTDGIRVSMISPGVVETEITESFTDERYKEAVRKRNWTPLAAEDIAEAIIYAVSQPPRVNVNEIFVLPTGQLY